MREPAKHFSNRARVRSRRQSAGSEFLWRFIRDWSEAVAEAFVILLALYILLWPVKIVGISMEDSISDGDWVLSCRLASWMSEPKTGDVVLFKVDGIKKDMVKRVVGTEGDELEIKSGSVYINGERLIEGYTKEPEGLEADDVFSLRIEEQSFFALGDNRLKSEDSRDFGQVPYSAVKAKVLFKLYPFNEVRALFLDPATIKRSAE